MVGMTTEDKAPDTKVPDHERARRLNANLAKVDELSKRLTAALTQRRHVDPALHGPAPDVYMKAAAAYFAERVALAADGGAVHYLLTPISCYVKALGNILPEQGILGTIESGPFKHAYQTCYG